MKSSLLEFLIIVNYRPANYSLQPIACFKTLKIILLWNPFLQKQVQTGFLQVLTDAWYKLLSLFCWQSLTNGNYNDIKSEAATGGVL